MGWIEAIKTALLTTKAPLLHKYSSLKLSEDMYFYLPIASVVIKWKTLERHKESIGY